MYIVIVGGNMTTEYLVSAMKGNHHRVTVIEEDLETVERLVEVLPRRVTVVYGDGCDSEA
ncbi:MAG: NAD-binding protein, partial [Coriobacteriales bacterium]